MAPVSGIAFTQAARNGKDSPNPFLPITLTTGEGTKKQYGLAVNAGMNDFIAKAMTSSTLFDHILTIPADPSVLVRRTGDMHPEHCGPRTLSGAI